MQLSEENGKNLYNPLTKLPGPPWELIADVSNSIKILFNNLLLYVLKKKSIFVNKSFELKIKKNTIKIKIFISKNNNFNNFFYY